MRFSVQTARHLALPSDEMRIGGLIHPALLAAALLGLGGLSSQASAANYSISDSLLGASLDPGLEIAPGYGGAVTLGGPNGAIFSTTGAQEAAIRSTFTFTGQWSLTINEYGINPGTQNEASAGIQVYGAGIDAALYAANDYGASPISYGYSVSGPGCSQFGCPGSQISVVNAQGVVADPPFDELALYGNTTVPLTFQVFLSGDLGPTNSVSFEDLTFTADSITSTSTGVPEPATWALMLVGFGGLGAAMRSRRRRAAAA